MLSFEFKLNPSDESDESDECDEFDDVFDDMLNSLSFRMTKQVVIRSTFKYTSRPFCNRKMRPQIPVDIKEEIIRQWLNGLSRDQIALNNYISTGATTNIINEWTTALGKPEADALRVLGRTIRSSGLSLVQCAVGFRIRNMLTSHGTDPDKAEQFVSYTIKKCNTHGITPDKLITHAEDLAKFSDYTGLTEIEGYVNQKGLEISELKKSEQEIRDRIDLLETERAELEKSRDVILEQKRNATEEMNSYFEAKQQLDKYGLSIPGDIQKILKTSKGIAEYGYEPKLILEAFNNNEYLNDRNEALKISTEGMQKEVVRLSNQRYRLKADINLHTEKLSVLNRLEAIGCDSKMLEGLLGTVLNIASTNGINHWLALDKFVRDIETQYDVKLGFESEIESLNVQIQILNEERKNRLNNLKKYPFIFSAVKKLFRLGLTETDILKMARTYLGLFNSTYSVNDMTTGIIMTIDMMMSMMPPATTNQSENNSGELTESLSKVRNDLSKINFTT